MTCSRVLVVAAVFASLFLPRGASAATPVSISVLRANPSEGHTGDVIYLSGYGFDPNTQLSLVIACPNYYSPDLNGNIAVVKGPVTDEHGRFVGYRVVAIPLNKVRFSPCTIYANVGPNPFGPDIPATYLILPPNQPLDPCAAHICPTVKAVAHRAKTGRAESIQVLAWPGATADIRLLYPHGRTLRHRVEVDWRGQATWVTKVSSSISPSTKVRIKVRCRLGVERGDGFGNFVLSH